MPVRIIRGIMNRFWGGGAAATQDDSSDDDNPEGRLFDNEGVD